MSTDTPDRPERINTHLSGRARIAINVVASLAVLTGAGPRAEAQFAGFAPPQALPTGSAPMSVSMGDFNGDGVLDLAVANYISGNVSIILDDGAGSFAPQQVFLTGNSPSSIVTGDLNGDGILDLALAGQGSSYGSHSMLSVLLGNGDGTFVSRSGIPFGASQNSVAMGDLNGDGALDLVVTMVTADQHSTTYSVGVLLGDGNGGFGPATLIPATGGPQSVVIADMNGDGALDIIFRGGGASILFGNGAGSFAPQQSFPAGAAPFFLAVDDLNGDNALDIVVTNFLGNGVPGTVSVLLGNGVGSFALPHTFPAGQQPTHVVIGDVDTDGALDIVVANNPGHGGVGTISVLLGDGAGSFAPQQTFPVGALPGSVAIGDLRHDGFLDIAVVNSNNTVSIFINQTAAPGDLNGDGVVNAADVASLLIAWGATGVPEDLNTDGVVNAADLAFLLTNWG